MQDGLHRGDGPPCCSRPLQRDSGQKSNESFTYSSALGLQHLRRCWIRPDGYVSPPKVRQYWYPAHFANERDRGRRATLIRQPAS